MAAYFRRLSKSTVGTALMVVFLVAILASFALSDVQSYLKGGLGSPGTLAKVGDAAVTERELSAVMMTKVVQGMATRLARTL